MATKKPQPTTDEQPATPARAAESPVALTYIGPPAAESDRYGALEPGRVYQEADPAFAAYLVATHPDHWTRA